MVEGEARTSRPLCRSSSGPGLHRRSTSRRARALPVRARRVYEAVTELFHRQLKPQARRGRSAAALLFLPATDLGAASRSRSSAQLPPAQLAPARTRTTQPLAPPPCPPSSPPRVALLLPHFLIALVLTRSTCSQTDAGVRRITKVDPNEALDKPNDPKTVRSPSSLSSPSRPRSRADRGSALLVQFLLLSGVNHALFGKRDAKQCVASSLPSLSPFPRPADPPAHSSQVRHNHARPDRGARHQARQGARRRDRVRPDRLRGRDVPARASLVLTWLEPRLAMRALPKPRARRKLRLKHLLCRSTTRGASAASS